MPAVLFVCSANRFRSMIAEVFFKRLLQEKHVNGRWTVTSAGTWAKEELPPLPAARKYAHSKGLDLEGMHSKEVNRDLLKRSDLVIVMTQGHQEALRIEFPEMASRIILLSDVSLRQIYDVHDPVEDPSNSLEEVGDEICSLVESGFDRICRKAIQGEMDRQAAESSS